MPVYKSAYRPETAMVKLCYDMVLTDKNSQLMKKAMDKDLDTTDQGQLMSFICFSDVRYWMLQNKLKINGSKNGIIIDWNKTTGIERIKIRVGYYQMFRKCT